MKDLDFLLGSSDMLKKIRCASHSFYIAKDIVRSKVFFPTKRIPLVVVFTDERESAKNSSAAPAGCYIEKVLCKLISCYGEDKTVDAISKEFEFKTTLKKLKSEVCAIQSKLSGEQSVFPFVLVCFEERVEDSKKFDFSDLIEIMIRLRGEGGCDWDRAQTHESIRINLIEEAYELVEAIDKCDRAMILEEAGDVLLQAVFHTHIEMDECGFDYSDMLSALCQKLLTRHTHIFGQNHAENEEQALNFWNDAKKVEKGYSNHTHSMKLVPKNLPSLLYACKIQKRAKKAGFDWDDINPAIDKISEELSELLSASQKNKAIEGGDLLFAVVNVLRFLNVEPEMALKASTEKFVSRFELLEKELTKDGSEMDAHTLEEMDAVWNSIKLCE